MFTRAFALGSRQYVNLTRTYCTAPLIRDPGVHVDPLRFARASEIKPIEVTEGNFFDYFDPNNKEPMVIHAVDNTSSNASQSEWIKNEIHTAHGRLAFSFFDCKKYPKIPLRLNMEPNEIAILYRGICVATSGNLSSAKNIHDFIGKYAWVLHR